MIGGFVMYIVLLYPTEAASIVVVVLETDSYRFYFARLFFDYYRRCIPRCIDLK